MKAGDAYVVVDGKFILLYMYPEGTTAIVWELSYRTDDVVVAPVVVYSHGGVRKGINVHWFVTSTGGFVWFNNIELQSLMRVEL